MRCRGCQYRTRPANDRDFQIPYHDVINISIAVGAVIKWRFGITIKYKLYLLERNIKIPTYISTDSYMYHFQVIYWTSNNLDT